MLPRSAALSSVPASDFYPGAVRGPPPSVTSARRHTPAPQVTGLHPRLGRGGGQPPSRVSSAVSTRSFPPVPSVAGDPGSASHGAQGPRGSELGLRTRPPPPPPPPWWGHQPASLPRRAPGARQAATPTRRLRPLQARPSPGPGFPGRTVPQSAAPAPPTHKDSRCLSCCSCCASCRRRFCSRRRCSSCSAGSRDRREPAPDDIAPRGGLGRRRPDASSAPQRAPANVPPARAAEPELQPGTRSQAPAAPEACGN